MDADLKDLITKLLTGQAAQFSMLTAQIKELTTICAQQSQGASSSSDLNISASTSIEQCKALEALANMIETFSYDEAKSLTFEAWYNRYRGVIAVGAAEFDDKAKTELVLMKLETTANALYRNSIAPDEPSKFTFNETITKLTGLFKKKISLLRTRWNCLHIRRA